MRNYFSIGLITLNFCLIVLLLFFALRPIHSETALPEKLTQAASGTDPAAGETLLSFSSQHRELLSVWRVTRFFQLPEPQTEEIEVVAPEPQPDPVQDAPWLTLTGKINYGDGLVYFLKNNKNGRTLKLSGNSEDMGFSIHSEESSLLILKNDDKLFRVRF